MKYKVNIQTIYEVGKRKDKEGRPHQEDSIFPAHGHAKESDRLFILCDGMGGHEAGEVASQTVCDAMSQTILSSNTPFDDNLLLRAIDNAYNKLDSCDYNPDVSHKMGTTLTLLSLHEGGATIAHMGDSRVYHIRTNASRQDEVLFHTRDHSLVNDLVMIGSITPEQAKHHPQKNIITRAMQPGLEDRCEADIYHTADIKKGDYFFLCSDGMLEEMEDHNLCNILSGDASDEEKAATLRQVTENNKDNHSAILVHILDVEGDAVAPKAAASNVDIDENELQQAEPHAPQQSEEKSSDDKPEETAKPTENQYPWTTIVLVVAMAALAMIFLL